MPEPIAAREDSPGERRHKRDRGLKRQG